MTVVTQCRINKVYITGITQGHNSQQCNLIHVQSKHMDYSVNMKPTNLYASGDFLEETVSPEVIEYAQYKHSGAKATQNKGFTC